MKLTELESRGFIEKVETDPRTLRKALVRARKDLWTAMANLKIDEEWAFAISYHAMLRAGRALMLHHGYRPKGKDQHKTVGEFCSSVLGEEYQNLIDKFHRMRRKRHKFVYESGSPISKSLASNSIENARKLVEVIVEIVKGESEGLFKKSNRDRP